MKHEVVVVVAEVEDRDDRGDDRLWRRPADRAYDVCSCNRRDLVWEVWRLNSAGTT